MKKYLLITAIAASVAFASCGSGSKNENSDTNQVDTTNGGAGPGNDTVTNGGTGTDTVFNSSPGTDTSSTSGQ